MIRVRFDGAQVTVSGHAGYAPAGRDIVCAAVSALVYALAGYLEETGQAERVDIRRGFADIRGTAAGAAARALERCGVEQLAQASPGCVEITGS